MIDMLTVLLAFLLLTGILLIGAFAYAIKVRIAQYTYNTQKDYRYDFTKGNPKTFTLDLNDSTLDIPQLEHTSTVVLQLTVTSSLLGKALLPSVVIETDETSAAQYFELGASGIRYIVIPTALTKNGGRIHFRGKHLKIPNQSVRLVAYDNTSVQNKRLLVVAPHPDDAEIAAYGLYSSLQDTWIVTITAGDSGESIFPNLISNPEKQRQKKGELRAWNSVTVPLLGSVHPENAFNLGYHDGTLKRMFLDSNTPASSTLPFNSSELKTYRKFNQGKLVENFQTENNWQSLVCNLKSILESVNPDIIVAPYPAIDAATDHKFTTVALFEALLGSRKKPDLFLYTNHHIHDERYPLGPKGSLVSLPPSHSDGVYFSSLFSFELDEELQTSKMIALEAMNDLRQNIKWMSTIEIGKFLYYKIEDLIFGRESSYFRRAVRPNELFYVINSHEISDKVILTRVLGEESSIAAEELISKVTTIQSSQ